MKQSTTKYMSLQQAAGMVADGALLALGGNDMSRLPMALVRELIRQGRKDLHLCGYRGGADFEMLAHAGCAAILDTPAAGVAMSFGDVTATRIGEAASFARFEAAAADLPYALIKPASEGGKDGDIVEIDDVFGSGPVTAVRRLAPDVAVIHAHAADIHGNVQMDMEFHAGFARDLVLARAAKRLIVTVEQIVSPHTVAKAPWKTVLPADAVDCVAEAPYGALPGTCEGRYRADESALAGYAEATRQNEALRQWFDDNVHAFESHAAYLDRLGMKHVQALTTKRSAYA